MAAPLSDESATLEELKAVVRRFCDALDWDQFHSAKDLAIGIITESSELLEHFRFQKPEDIERLLKDPKKRAEVGAEIADIMYFIVRFAQLYGFDIAAEMEHKLQINEKRYPVEKSRGNSRKYDAL